MIADLVHQLADLVAAHPVWAGALAFFAAGAEAIVVLGALVPGSVILVALGVLAGTGKLALWPLLIAATAGGLVGDLAAYGLGWWLGDRAATVWPFATRPELLASGKRFFDRHGGKSVLIGRFVPGIKTIVPAMAGMLRMPPGTFVPAAFAASIAWAPAMILPAAAAGMGLVAVQAVSTRLVVLLVSFIAAIVLVVVLFRVVVRWILPAAHRRYVTAFRHVSATRKLPAPVLRMFDPERASLLTIGAWELVFALSVIAFAAIVRNVFGDDPLAQIDLAVNGLMASVRTAWADDVMVVIASFGDAAVVVPVGLVAAVYLTLVRTPIVAAAFAISLAAAEAFVALTKLILVARVRVADPAHYSFPSGHVAVAMTLFGLVASVLARSLAPTARLVTLAVAVALGSAVGMARIYLAAVWTTDAMIGMLFGLTIVAAFNLWFGSTTFRRAQPRQLAALAAAALAVIGTWHAASTYDVSRPASYAEPRLVVVPEADWLSTGWTGLAQVRSDFQGEPEEPFVLQFAGAPERLRRALAAAGWAAAPAWSVIAGLNYLSPVAELPDLPVVPTLDRGAAPVLTLVRNGPDGSSRQVLRLWQSGAAVDTGTATTPIYLGSLTVQRPVRVGWLLTTPDTPAPPSDWDGLHAALSEAAALARVQPRAPLPDLLLGR